MLSSSTRSFSVSPPLSPECPNILIFMTSPASLFRTRALHSRIAPSGSLREDPDSSGLITHIESHPEGITCKIEWPAACSQADAPNKWKIAPRLQRRMNPIHLCRSGQSGTHSVALWWPTVSSCLFSFLLLFSSSSSDRDRLQRNREEGRKQPCCDATMQSVLTAGPTGSAARATDVPARVSASAPHLSSPRTPPHQSKAR